MIGRITALRVQAGNKDRVNVYLDNQFAFALARIEAARLRIGQELSPADVERLKRADSAETAYARALNFLSPRPRSESEVRQFLKKKVRAKKKEPEKETSEAPAERLDEALIDQVIARLKRAGLLNDEAFAQYWVENRAAFRPRGKRALKAELRGKGLSAQAIDNALAGADDAAAAWQLAAGRAPRLKTLPRREFWRKLGDYLARRGIDYEIISETVERAWREFGGDDHSAEGED